MRILIVGDLHGKKPKIHFKDFDYIIAPGDFCSDDPRKYMFMALKKELESLDSKKSEWYNIIGMKKAKRMIKKSLRDGRKILKFLNSLEVPVYIVPGNWDWTEDKDSNSSFLKKNNYANMIKNISNIKDVHNKKLKIGDFEVIGYGISSGPEYPQNTADLKLYTKKELKKKKIEYKKEIKKVESLFKKASKPIIFLSHNVPFNTSLDKITNRQSPRYGEHYGSLIAKKVIEKYQPLLCIGGHMHEHFGMCKIKNTTCINAGFGSDINTSIELENWKIKKIKFYRG